MQALHRRPVRRLLDMMSFSRTSFFGDRDGLDVSELPDPESGEFAAVTGSFDATEWDGWIGRDLRIDEGHSGFDLANEELLLGGVSGPDAGSEAIGTIV